MDNLEQAVSEITNTLEQQVDEEINRLDNMKSDDFETLRKARFLQMKKANEERQKWRDLGHGYYAEITSEPVFFAMTKKSERVVLHFYRDGAERCKIVDMHFQKLAPKHLETKFTTMNAPKSPFLAKRLNITVIPTIICVINQKVVDRIVGFTELGNRDDFSTRMLEWRLAQRKAILYDGDLTTPPPAKEPKNQLQMLKKRSIREKDSDSEDDDSEASFSE